MSEISWTENQLLAIEQKGTDLLVSAAAGSGKTAVLTERIIRQLTDVMSPVDITDFLIVTFTVSATSELRDKLSRAIRNAYSENKSLKRLKKQLINLPSAKIMTIDSFCKYIVTECAKQLNIPADFQTGEESELNVLMNDAVSETLDDFFNGFKREKLYDTSFLPIDAIDFISVVESFSTQKSFSSLNETIIDLYNKLMRYPDPMSMAKNYLKVYYELLKEHYLEKKSNSFFDSVPGRFITAEIKESILTAIKYFEEAEKSLTGFDSMSEKYAPIIQDDIASATRLYNLPTEELLEQLLAHKFMRLTNYTPKDENELTYKNKFRDFRDEGRELINKLKKKYPITDEEKIFNQTAITFAIANELFTVICEIHERLSNMKLEKKIFSFDDISQLAYKALVKEGTYNHTTREFERTDYAVELGEKFHEILIDEYQDVDELQDTIFRAISNSHNRFMVGDLKQCIYKFRGATPEIFLEYRNTFAPIASVDCVPRLVSLQNNFRSDKSVIDFVNSLFDVVMNFKNDDIYRKDDYLVFSKASDEELPVELTIIENDVEYDYVADKILESVKDGDFEFKDICILARKHDSLKAAQEKFSERGIPSDYTPTENFFSSYEIQTIHSLLKTIDNPCDDVSFLSALSGPIFAFTPAEILSVREGSPNSDMYFSVRDYCGKDELLLKKCKKVVNQLKKWRNKSRTAGADTLIWWLYLNTNLMSFIKKMNDGEERRENLLLYYEIATKFEEREFKGLTKFLSYVDSFKASKSKIKKDKSSENSVHLMTIHDSKGLEFPFCFYVSSNSQISRADEKKVVMSETFGPSFAIPVGEIGGKITTYMEKAATSEIRSSTMEEELRLLYVALTRAKNKLIITGHAKIADLIKYTKLSSTSKTAFTYNLKNAISMIKVISLGLYHDPIFKQCIEEYEGDNLSVSSPSFEVNLLAEYQPIMLSYQMEEKAKTESNCKLTPDIINDSLSKVGNDILTQTPYKISVSTLREGLLDEGSTGSILSAKKRPEFASLTADNISAFTGTAMHVFMQFCNFDNCKEKGTEYEAERLLKYGFIDESQKAVLNHNSLMAFFKSETYKNICNAKHVHREKRYTLLVPSSRFYNDNERSHKLDELNKKTLIQGVIDCYYINPDDSITLIDFKTDSVNKKEGEEILKKRHSAQMQLYKEAIEEIEGRKVDKAFIYSFCLSKEIEI